MSQYQDNLTEARKQVNKREFVILALFVIIISLVAANMYALKEIKVSINPGIEDTTQYKRGEVDPVFVYSFTNGLVQSLYTWVDDGQQEYIEKINSLKNFMTPMCFNDLKKDFETRDRHGELRNRVRQMTPVQWDEGGKQVKEIPPGKWVVRLQYDMLETVRGVPIKHGRYYWDIPVIKDSSKKHLNKYELSIDCPFVNNSPVLVEEYKK